MNRKKGFFDKFGYRNKRDFLIFEKMFAIVWFPLVYVTWLRFETYMVGYIFKLNFQKIQLEVLTLLYEEEN